MQISDSRFQIPEFRTRGLRSNTETDGLKCLPEKQQITAFDYHSPLATVKKVSSR
jgi:hypothetical protein